METINSQMLDDVNIFKMTDFSQMCEKCDRFKSQTFYNMEKKLKKLSEEKIQSFQRHVQTDG